MEAVVSDARIETGGELFVQVQTADGRTRARGRIISVAKYHFRVKCESSFREDEIEPGQEVEIRRSDGSRVLPLSTRFIRFGESGTKEMVLSLPECRWRRNRRSFVRAPISMKVTLIRKDRPRIVGQTINISGSGALIETDIKLLIGEELRIAFEIAMDRVYSVGAGARVKWESKGRDGLFKYGIQFLQIVGRDQNRICRMVLLAEFESRRVELREFSEFSGRISDR